MRKFELFMGYLGNGCTVCNKAVEEHGDYKQVAHISNAGNIKFYVPVESIPGDALLRIEHVADTHRANFAAWMDAEINARPAAMYGRILDALPWEEYKRHKQQHADIKDCKALCEALRGVYMALM